MDRCRGQPGERASQARDHHVSAISKSASSIKGHTNVSVVVLTKNEENNIHRCVEALEWAEEVVVIDDGSIDNTVQIATRLGARVINHSFKSFASQRNWALEHAGLRNEWVLMLDADEVSTDEFAAEICNAIVSAESNVNAFRTCRKTMLDGVWLKHSDGFPVWIMRLVRLGRASFQDSGHGEVPVPAIEGTIGTIRSPFIHFAFSRGMDDWWMRHVRYAGREAAQEREHGTDTSVLSLFSLDASLRRRALRTLARKTPARGLLRFFYQYVLRGGFLDGAAGLRFCRMMASYEGMIAIRSTEPKPNGEFEEN